jgi:hypothetical protein
MTVNRYQVRISVVEQKPAPNPLVVMGARSPDKLLDASFTTDDIQNIRSIVDGLLFEGIPDTQREDEKEDGVPEPLRTLMRDGASGQLRYGNGEPKMPPTVDADLPPVKTPIPEGEELKGGKHSGNCSCSACEPILPGEIATIQVPPSLITPRPVRDDPQA